MHNFDTAAVQRGNDVALPVSARGKFVAGQGKPGVDADGQAQPGGRQQDAERHGRSAHVFVHSGHTLSWLQVVPARVETDAFTHHGDQIAKAFRPVGKTDDGGIVVSAAAGDGEKGASAELLEAGTVVFVDVPAKLGGKLMQAFAVGARRQKIGGECGERPRQQVGFGQSRRFCSGFATPERQGLQRFGDTLALEGGQGRAIGQGDVGGRFESMAAELRRAVGDDVDPGRSLAKQQLGGLTQQRKLFEGRFFCVEPAPDNEATFQRRRQRGSGQVVQIFATARQDGGQRLPVRTVFR
ncbi:MAG: hypothetical protein BWY57_02062 [Betaproteobacteria bacterium ADurb.Bin341]|nr:MAG: hypothetical protein BWY57_02062 [Betaproteobacteria bacterium ADurb.Bin341]